VYLGYLKAIKLTGKKMSKWVKSFISRHCYVYVGHC